MSGALYDYLLLEERWVDLLHETPGSASPEIDDLVDRMDALWPKLTKEDHEWLLKNRLDAEENDEDENETE